jgi:hypothetical protein
MLDKQLTAQNPKQHTREMDHTDSGKSFTLAITCAGGNDGIVDPNDETIKDNVRTCRTLFRRAARVRLWRSRWLGCTRNGDNTSVLDGWLFRIA